MQKQPIRPTLIGSSAYIFAIRAFPVLAATAVLLLFARRLPAELYGGYQKFWAQWSVLNAVACLGLPSLLLTMPAAALISFAAKIRPKHMLPAGGWLLFSGVLFFLFQKERPIASWWAPPAFLALFALINVLDACLLLLRRLAGLAWVSGAYALGFMAVHIAFLHRYVSMEALFGWLVLLALLRLAVTFYLYQKAKQLYEPATQVIAEKTVRHLWLHLGIYDVSQNVFRWLDKFLLAFVLTPASFALYFNGTVDVPFLALLLGAVGSALLLQMTADANDDTGRVRMARQAGAMLGRVVFPVFMFLAVFRYDIFALFFPKYRAAAHLFLISILVLPLRAYNFTAILQHKGKGRTVNAGALLDLVIALVLMYPMYRLWGLSGVAMAFVISTYAQAGFYLRAVSKLTGCGLAAILPGQAWLWLLAGTGAGYLALHQLLISFFNERIRLVAGSGITLLLVVALTAPYFFSKKKLAYGEEDQPQER